MTTIKRHNHKWSRWCRAYEGWQQQYCRVAGCDKERFRPVQRCHDGAPHRWCKCEECKTAVCSVCDAVRHSSESKETV